MCPRKTRDKGRERVFLGHYTKSKELETSTLDKLANTKDQRAYEQLYQSYLKQREHNKQINHILNRVEYALQQKDYDGVANELQNYQTIQEEGMKNLTQEWSKTQLQPTIPDATDYPMPDTERHINWSGFPRTILHDFPETEKLLLMGLLTTTSPVAPDAYKLANISENGFETQEDYIQKNGFMVNSISDLPFETIKSKVQTKVMKQLGVNDSKGLIFMPHSSLSLEIKNNKQFKDYVLQNLLKLIKGEHIEGSLAFELRTPNLYGALKCVGILDTYINDH